MIVALTIGVALFVPGAQPPARAVPQIAQNILAQLAVNFATQASGVPIGRVLNIGNARVLAELKEIRAELDRINSTLNVLKTQVDGISIQVKQNGCDTNAGPASTIVATAIAGARLLKDIADHPSSRDTFLPDWNATIRPNIGESKQIDLNNLLIGSGGTTGILMACGKAEQAADHPFLSRQIYLRMRTILAYYQDAETTLLLLRANQAALEGKPEPVVERYIKEVKDWLAAQQQIIDQRAMSAGYFIDLRTHIAWQTTPYVVNGANWESLVNRGPADPWGLRRWGLAADYQVKELYSGYKDASNPAAWLHKMVGMTWIQCERIIGTAGYGNCNKSPSPSDLKGPCYWSSHYRDYAGSRRADRHVEIFASGSLWGDARMVSMHLAGPNKNSQNYDCYALFGTRDLPADWQKKSYG